MSKRSFTDRLGNTYSVEVLSGESMSITHEDYMENEDISVTFGVEDADRLAAMILDAAQEAKK